MDRRNTTIRRNLGFFLVLFFALSQSALLRGGGCTANPLTWPSALNGVILESCKGENPCRKHAFNIIPPLITLGASTADIACTAIALHNWSDHDKREEFLDATTICAIISYLGHSFSMYGPIAELYHKTGAIQKTDFIDLAGRTCFTFILFADVFTSMIGESLHKSAAKEWEITSLVCTCIVWLYSVYHVGHYFCHCRSHADAEYKQMHE